MPTHIYFNDDEEQAAGTTAAQAQQQHAGNPAAVAAVGAGASSPSAVAGPQMARCCSSARVDYNFADPCYVFKVARSPDGARLAATLSNNAIKTYSVHADSLSHAGDIQAHAKRINDASFPFQDAPQALYSCSADGTVRGFDARNGQEAER